MKILLVEDNEILAKGLIYSLEQNKYQVIHTLNVEDTLKIQIYNTLVKVEKELATTIGSIDIWKLNGENFEIVTKMRELKDSIEEIKAQCK